MGYLNEMKNRKFMSSIANQVEAMLKYFNANEYDCELTDEDDEIGIVFLYNDTKYTIHFYPSEGYTKCSIGFYCVHEDYAALDLEDKTFMADKVQTECENHSTVLAYNDEFYVRTYFYYTNETMLIELFEKHLDDLKDSVNSALEIVCYKIDEKEISEKERENENKRPIGFKIRSSKKADEQADNTK